MTKESDEFKGGKIHEILLERLRFEAKNRIPKEILASTNAEFLADSLSSDLIFQWKAAIAGQGLRTIRYPKDWRQAFKERWFPKRFRKWWPVEYKVIDIYALYPSIAMPDKFTGIHIQESLSKDNDEWQGEKE
ncbi:hypothetical protein ES703_32422 [subsurface metagenome]